MSPSHPPSEADLARALRQVARLKQVPRAGWQRVGLNAAESVADHGFGAIALALLLGPRLGVGVDRLVRLLIVHDLAESDPAVGDITPFCGVDRSEKHRREAEAMRRLCRDLPDGESLLALWLEYEAGTTPEADLAHQLDALEMGLQARAYQETHGLDLSEFIESASRRVGHPLLRALLEAPMWPIEEPGTGASGRGGPAGPS